MSTTQHLNVETAYDRWAPTYDAMDNPMVYAASHALASGLGSVRGQDCLEFGCGTGRNLGAMAQAGARTITGLDVSAAMLDRARARNSAIPPFNWNLIQHDMMQVPPLAGASANFILFSLSLEHVDDVAVPLVYARRQLRRNGIIRIVEIHPFMSLSGVGAHFVEGDTEVTMPTFPHQFESWMKAIKKSNLEVESMREWRTSDFGEAAPAKILQRGPNWPWLVDFVLRAR